MNAWLRASTAVLVLLENSGNNSPYQASVQKLHLGDVETLLPDARGDQRVELALPEVRQHLHIEKRQVSGRECLSKSA